MSIRNSIEQITNKNMQIQKELTIDEKNKEYYKNFLLLLEKSFNVKSGVVNGISLAFKSIISTSSSIIHLFLLLSERFYTQDSQIF